MLTLRKGMHPLAAAILGAIGGVLDAQALRFRMALDLSAKANGRNGKTGSRPHDRGGNLRVRRAAVKARNVARNRRAHK